MKSIRNRRGMTLIEIMIVLAIIGSIATILLPKIVGSQDKANIKNAKIQMSQIMNSLTLYSTDCGHYPSSLNGLIQQDSGCSNWGPEAYYKTKNKEPIKDPWGHEFVYELNGAEYTLKCLGKDGAEGGTSYSADFTQDDI